MKFSFSIVDGIEAHYEELAREWITDIKKHCKIDKYKLKHGNSSSVYIYAKINNTNKILSIRDHDNFSSQHPLPDYAVVIKIGTKVKDVENILQKSSYDIKNLMAY
jgi:hypothetical protein